MAENKNHICGEEPVISVLVVTYRQADTLGRTLRSVLAQNLDHPFEVIVADDASGDGTVDVARRFEAEYPGVVRVLENERNLGVQENYFNALREARGEYIADCAGDDYWSDEQKLAKELDMMRRNPEMTLVHTGFQYLFPDGRREPFRPKSSIRREVVPGRKVLRQIVAHPDTPVIHLCSALYRRDVVLQAMEEDHDLFFNPEWGLEDLQVEAVCAAAGEIGYIPDKTLCYSVGHPSVSSADSHRKAFDFYLGSTALRLRLIEKYGLEGEDIDAGVARLLNYVAAQARHAKYRGGIAKINRLRREYDLPLPMKGKIHSLLCAVGI